MSRKIAWSKTVTFFDDGWHDGNVPIMGPRTHGAWLGTSVFDGARAFEGVMPDLDLHCARINKSAEAMCLKPVVPAETWMALVQGRPQAVRARCRTLYPADYGLGKGVVGGYSGPDVTGRSSACPHPAKLGAPPDQKKP